MARCLEEFFAQWKITKTTSFIYVSPISPENTRSLLENTMDNVFKSLPIRPMPNPTSVYRCLKLYAKGAPFSALKLFSQS